MRAVLVHRGVESGVAEDFFFFSFLQTSSLALKYFSPHPMDEILGLVAFLVTLR